MATKAKQSTNIVAQMLGKLITTLLGIDANQDGKIVWTETLNATQTIVMMALVNIPGFDLQEFKENLRELKENPSARNELIEIFAKEFDLNNDVVEYLIEDTIHYLEDGLTLSERWIKVFKTEEVPGPSKSKTKK